MFGIFSVTIHISRLYAQIIDKQSQTLKELREKDLIDDFRHMELQQILNDFYTHQGKCERIKKFPLPRQYGSISFIFVGIFIVLLPFGMIPLYTNHWHAALRGLHLQYILYSFRLFF